jgi:hypothetical protein
MRWPTHLRQGHHQTPYAPEAGSSNTAAVRQPPDVTSLAPPHFARHGLAYVLSRFTSHTGSYALLHTQGLSWGVWWSLSSTSPPELLPPSGCVVAAQGPGCTTDTPSQSASHSLSYCCPSLPHTARACGREWEAWTACQRNTGVVRTCKRAKAHPFCLASLNT